MSKRSLFSRILFAFAYLSFMLSKLSHPFILLLLGIVFFIPYLGAVHLFDWDEINFAESAREMIVTGNYAQVQINFEPFWEKPPLFFWLQAASMHAFGINEFAARFPNALVGILTLLSLYVVGSKINSSRFGFLWALAHFGSFLPHLYFKSGIIDPLFNLLVFWGCVLLFYKKNESPWFAVLSGVAFGLAILTKGPVAILIGGLVLVSLWGLNRFQTIVSFKKILITIFSGLLIASVWFGYEIWTHGYWFIEKFVEYQIRLFSTPDSGHGQPFYYHFVVVLFGCFPSSVFALFWFLAKRGDFSSLSIQYQANRLMAVLFWVVMILFSLTTTKIVHYSSMTYFSVSYFAAILLSERNKQAKAFWWSVGLIGGLFALLLTAVPLVGMNTEKIVPFIKDTFAVANLQAEANWNGYEWLIGAGYFAVICFTILGNQLPRKKTIQSHLSFITHHSSLFFATAICLFLYGIFVVPKIEKYTQAAAIEFYESKAGQNVEVEVLGFKSYAQLFYFKKPLRKAIPLDSLLRGKIQRPVFFVSKIDRPESYQHEPNLEIITQKNGFVFLRRNK